MTATTTGVDTLDELFATTRSENRAALVGYLPVGYPGLAQSADFFTAMISGGCDLVEIGVPFSDPVIDGTVIQQAQGQALAAGVRLRDVLSTVEAVTAVGGRAVVMSYINPLLAYGFAAFARDLAAAGGAGVITPDLIVDEADEWTAATKDAGIASIFLVAPSSPMDRIIRTTAATSGFLYAAATMGVTGARDKAPVAAPDLVQRCRLVTDLPIGVGLGVSTGDQAAVVAGYADAVIVGTAFVARAGQPDGLTAVTSFATELADGVRRAQPTPEVPSA